MLNKAARFTLLLSTIVLATACGDGGATTTARLTIQTSCATDTDCPTGFQCEIEAEHGVTSSSCTSDDPDATCPAGYEAESEHGQTFCKPHGGGTGGTAGGGADDGSASGDDDGAGGGAGDGSGSGSGSGGSATCASDSDCPAGLECEIEVEHGQTTSSCKPHGGHA